MNPDAKDPLADRPWPKKGDRLFSKPPKATRRDDPTTEDRTIGIADYLMREGYYCAGDLLATTLIERARESWPGVVFPMLFCYRHYLELSLKAIIPDLAKLAKQQIGINLAAEHSLGKLWNEFRGHARVAYPPHEDSDPTDDIVERCINEMNQVDKNSQAFRYITDKKGNLIAHDLSLLEIQQLQKTMTNLRHYFEGADIYAGVLLESQRDIDSMYP